MSDLSEIKADARRQAKVARKAAHAAVTDASARAMAHFLSGVPVSHGQSMRGDIVSGYRPIHSELDVTPLMLALHAQGVTLCVPVIDGAGQPLSFARWTPDMPMTKGEFGAEVPETIERIEPTLIIAPMLSFDRALYRLGYGGGFYDRTLEGLRARRATRAFGYAYSAQEVAHVPIEPTDQRLDGVVTEDGLIAG